MIIRWDESTRAVLTSVLPESLVLIATGAVEQHGPHLPTGTDILLSSTVLTRAAQDAAPRSRTNPQSDARDAWSRH